jgi:hypothetical protein
VEVLILAVILKFGFGCFAGLLIFSFAAGTLLSAILLRS